MNQPKPRHLSLLLLGITLSLTTTVDLYAQTGQDTHRVQAGETLYSISQRYDIAVSDLREWNDLESDNLSVGTALRLTPPSESQSVTHTVGARETLFAISRRYGVTIAEIQQWNRLESTSLSEGQQLVIHLGGAPEGAATPESPAARREPPTETPSPATSNDIQPEAEPLAEAEAEALQPATPPVTAPDEGASADTVTDGPPAPAARPESATVQHDTTLPGSQSDSLARARESIVAPPSSVNTYYTVRTGDYLNRIAAEHGMTTEELRRLNQLDSDLLRVGQQLIVRSHEATPVVDPELGESTPQGRFVTYRIQSGDSAERLMERFSISMEALEALNPGTNFNTLSSGQRITVLLPPSRQFANPYRRATGLRGLGEIPALRYDEGPSTPTTSGELYDPEQLTAAHPNMALGSIVYLENPDNGRGSYVKINDRFSGEGIKLSRYAYQLLELEASAQARVVLYQEE